MKKDFHAHSFRLTLSIFFMTVVVSCIFFLFLTSIDTSKKGSPFRPALVSPTSSSTPLFPVSYVLDGDTIEVLIDGKKERVRLIGIDSPEFGDEKNPEECFARESSQRMKELVDRKKVRLESDPTQSDRDIYGRLLRYVFSDGTFVNLAMVADGFAREYTYRGNSYRYQQDFRGAVWYAKDKKLGLWADGVCVSVVK